MKRFVEGEDRSQSTLFPERLDEYVAEDNSVRVIDVFVDELDLGTLGFERVEPKQTGRPAYHPATMLKIYIYGYLNRIQSSRRLERESHRNVELMWLTGRLMPDFKTISDFRKDNGPAIQRVCREFIELCRRLNLFSQTIVAIDGSKFNAMNNKDRNDTRASMKRRIAKMEEHIARYLSMLDDVDQEELANRDMTVPDLGGKISSLKEEMQRLKKRERELHAHPDKQLSDTDPDSRLMKVGGGKATQVSYNVQTAVDTKHKLIVAHEVTNAAVDRNLLFQIASLAKSTLQKDHLTVLADRGYYKGEEIKACVEADIHALVPKTHTSPNKALGYYDRGAFRYDATRDEYRCPAGEALTRRRSRVEDGRVLINYRVSSLICEVCKLKPKCTKSNARQLRRWEHEDVLEAMQEKLCNMPEAMAVRASTVEHPYGTLKSWMGSSHFLMKRLKNVRTEMSLHVLAYNLRRMISIKGAVPLMMALRA